MTVARSLPTTILSPLLTPFTAHAGTERTVIIEWFDSMCLSQRRPHWLTRFLLIFFLSSVPCFGQAWSGVISSSRAITWTGAGLPATLPDGETTAVNAVRIDYQSLRRCFD
jgi:hypothetical protein